MLESVLSMMNLAEVARSSSAFTAVDYLVTSTCAKDNPFFCVRNLPLELQALALGDDIDFEE